MPFQKAKTVESAMIIADITTQLEASLMRDSFSSLGRGRNRPEAGAGAQPCAASLSATTWLMGSANECSALRGVAASSRACCRPGATMSGRGAMVMAAPLRPSRATPAAIALRVRCRWRSRMTRCCEGLEVTSGASEGSLSSGLAAKARLLPDQLPRASAVDVDSPSLSETSSSIKGRSPSVAQGIGGIWA